MTQSAPKLGCALNEVGVRVNTQRPSERRTEPQSTLYEVWIKTKDLGWFRSAVRASAEEAEKVAGVLRKNFEVEVVGGKDEL